MGIIRVRRRGFDRPHSATLTIPAVSRASPIIWQNLWDLSRPAVDLVTLAPLTQSNVTQGVSGDVATRFAGTADTDTTHYVDLGPTWYARGIRSNFTLLVRVKQLTQTWHQVYISDYNTSGSSICGFEIFRLSTGDTYFRVHDSGGTPHDIIVSGISLGDWHTFVMTFDGSTLKAWYDGVYAGSVASSGSIYQSNGAGAYIGLRVPATSPSLPYALDGWASVGALSAQTAPDGYAQLLSANPGQLFEPGGFFVPIQDGGVANGTLTSAGAAVASFVGAALDATTLTAAGTGAASFVGAIAGSSLTAAGAATASFTGAALGSGTLSGSGAATGTFTGSALTNSTLSSNGVGVASFVGSSIDAGSAVLSISGIGAASFVGSAYIDSVLSSYGSGFASFLTNALGLQAHTGGGSGKGKNLTLKQKKKLKAVVNQEWLKAEETVRELLQDRLGNAEPAKTRVERLTAVQSLGDVIAALQALSKEAVTLPEQQAVIKSFEKSIDTKIVKTGERLVSVEDKVNITLGRIEKKIQNLEDLLIVVIDELL